MRNARFIATPSLLQEMLALNGFADIRLLDVTATTIAEHALDEIRIAG